MPVRRAFCRPQASLASRHAALRCLLAPTPAQALGGAVPGAQRRRAGCGPRGCAGDGDCTAAGAGRHCRQPAVAGRWVRGLLGCFGPARLGTTFHPATWQANPLSHPRLPPPPCSPAAHGCRDGACVPAPPLVDGAPHSLRGRDPAPGHPDVCGAHGQWQQRRACRCGRGAAARQRGQRAVPAAAQVCTAGCALLQAAGGPPARLWSGPPPHTHLTPPHPRRLAGSRCPSPSTYPCTCCACGWPQLAPAWLTRAMAWGQGAHR